MTILILSAMGRGRVGALALGLAVTGMSGVCGCKKLARLTEEASSRDALVVSLHEKDGELRDQLQKQRAAAGARTFLVMTTAEWCPPCKVFEAHLRDPEVQAALANTTLVRVDLDEFSSNQLTTCGYSPSSVPWLMKVGSDLRPVDAVADEWDTPTGASIAHVITSFAAGTLTTRKYDWRQHHGFPSP